MDNTLNLTEQTKCAKIDSKKRKIEIFSQLLRHLIGILYLIAELAIGERPEKL